MIAGGRQIQSGKTSRRELKENAGTQPSTQASAWFSRASSRNSTR
jgi:hypothetical protein